jgi:Tfp pilus assembly protein PilF
MGGELETSDMALLQRLQQAHDRFEAGAGFIEAFKERAKAIAEDFKLEWRFEND